ncbi:hypothetical protein NDU88_002090 [Pleurodeles waltl]|uniref:Uncharacterized protein n=1 Tax=Pleurodeles waltl TaxID=8319 RepID=A0AAV7LBD1_PLEWA|nr:hypothetical protein NDU88_002090 [Pleurodeles waltl]
MGGIVQAEEVVLRGRDGSNYCESPEHTPTFFRSNSVSGCKVKLLPELGMERASEVSKALPVVQKQVQRGTVKFPRRLGGSFQQRVVSRGRGVSEHGAVTGLDRLGPGLAVRIRFLESARRSEADFKLYPL